MIEEQRENPGEKETGRLEAFSDGVFAVAITLLVFDLKVPSPETIHSAGELANQLAIQWPSYMSFFLSFATILVMWVNHHKMFSLIHKSSMPFMFVNGFLLLLVTTVPFPTSLVSTYLLTPAAETACAIYAGLFVVINFAYILLWWVAAHWHHLLKEGVSPALVKHRTLQYFFGFPCYIVALVVAFWNPGVSIAICSFLWIFWGLVSLDLKILPDPFSPT